MKGGDDEMQRALDYRLPKSEQRKNSSKPTYVKGNILGKEERYEGSAAAKASRRDKNR